MSHALYWANVLQEDSETLGIGIAGGRFSCGYDTPIYVTNIQPDGCLAKTGQICVSKKETKTFW
jgi:hypothetical protein